MSRRFSPARVKAIVAAYKAAEIDDYEIEIAPDGTIRAKRSSAPKIADEAEEIERRIREGLNGGTHP